MRPGTRIGNAEVIAQAPAAYAHAEYRELTEDGDRYLAAGHYSDPWWAYDGEHWYLVRTWRKRHNPYRPNPHEELLIEPWNSPPAPST